MASFGKKKVRKIVLVGEGGVGKTSLRRRYLGEGFTYNYIMTIGADFGIKKLDDAVFQIWDLAGQPRFELVREGYYKGTKGALIVFDISRPITFDKIPNWVEEIVGHLEQMIPFVLVGNKADLREGLGDYVVDRESAVNYAKALAQWCGFDVPYVETSALTGLNVNEIFAKLMKQIEALESTL